VPHPPKINHSRGPKAVKVDPEHILEAAERVFAREGLKGGSIRAIAREAGCDPALIYYHFENKEAVFTTMLDRKFPPLIQNLERLADPLDLRHTSERFWDALRTLHRHVGQDAGFRATVRGELTRGAEGVKDTIAQHVRPVFVALTSLFQQGVQRGHIRPEFPQPLGVFFFVRLYIEILDIVPVMALRIAHIPVEQALALAERSWFELYWRGISTRPEDPLPFLEMLKETHP
jgi:AcrR family transcriptional regulator